MNHRTFLRGAALAGAALAGAAGLVEPRPDHALAEPPPETTKIRLTQIEGICVAPQYVAEELLKSEGFSDVRYVKVGVRTYDVFASGGVDIRNPNDSRSQRQDRWCC